MNDIFNYSISEVLIDDSIYYLIESEFEKLKRETNDKAKEIIITTFVNLLLKKPNIDLENAILRFENIENKNLDEFSKSKSRKKKGYINIYKIYFERAKNIITNIEVYN